MSGKLYWRIKKNGKWTFVAASDQLRIKVKELGYGITQEEEE